MDKILKPELMIVVRLRRLCLVAMVLTLILIGCQTWQMQIRTVYSADINNVAQLGGNDLTHYNGIVFHYFEAAQADIEGAIAVGGDSKIGTSGQYDMGAGAAGNYHTVAIGTYKNPNNYPTLLLQNAPTVGRNNGANNIHVYGGPLVLAESARSAYESGANKIVGTTRYAANDTVSSFFALARTRFQGLSATLNRANTQHEITLYDLVNPNANLSTIYSNMALFEPDNLNTGSYRVLVVNVNAPGYAEINTPRITNTGSYDLIIFNFPTTTGALFTGGSLIADGNMLNTSAPGFWYPSQNATLAKYCNKVVWNFPVAQSVQVNGAGVVGSVIAPAAYVEGNGGSINGMLVANSFVQKGGMELHGFKLFPPILDFDNDDEDEDEDDPEGSVIIYKRDNDDRDTLLDGAVFDLDYLENGNWVSRDTNVIVPNGVLRLTELPLGRYRLTEVTPPDGYTIIAGGAIEFEITAAHVSEPQVVQVYNEKIPEQTIDVPIQKVDNSGSPLAGARFALYREHDDGGVKTYTLHDEKISETNGFLYFYDLPAGTYYLIEVEAAEGWGIDPDYALIRIMVWDNAGSLQYAVYKGQSNDPVIRIPNLPSADGRLVVSKLSTADDLDQFGHKKPLEGAVFRLYLWDGSDWQPYPNDPDYEQESDQFGQAVYEGLIYGDYKLVEEIPPSGYGLGSMTEHIFTVDGSDLEHFVTFENPPVGSLEVTKEDSGDGSPLPGAKFELYRQEGQSLMLMDPGMVTTDPGGIARWDKLAPGTYYLVETEAPPGYLLPDHNTTQVVIPNGGSYQVQITVENDPEPSTVEAKAILTKLDASNSNLELPNVEFHLYRWTEPPYEFLHVKTDYTDSNGQIEMSNMQPGIYKLIEVSNPNGDYLITGGEEIIFSIVTTGVTQVGGMTLYNELRQPSISLEIVKQDRNGGELLAGAMFDLWYWPLNTTPTTAANATVVQTDLTTGSDGWVRVEQLVAGQYRLVETRKPLGYENNIEVYVQFTVQDTGGGLALSLDHAVPASDVVLDTNQNQILFTVYNDLDLQFPDMKVYKVDATDRSIYLPGAEFALYRKPLHDPDEDFMLYGVMTSNQDGLLMFPFLIEGDYRLDETKPPDGYILRDKLFFFYVENHGTSANPDYRVYYDGLEITQDMSGKLVVINHKGGDTLTPVDPDPENPGRETPAPTGSTSGGGSNGGSGGYFSGGSYSGSGTDVPDDTDHIGSVDLPLYGLHIPQTGDRDYRLYYLFAFFASLWGILTLLDPESRVNRKRRKQ